MLGAAGTMILVPDIFVYVEVPGALIERDFLAGFDGAPRHQGDLVGKPGIRVAAMIEIFVEAGFRGVLAQREIYALSHLPDRAHAIDIGLEIRRRNDLATEFHQLLASPDRCAGYHADAVNI